MENYQGHCGSSAGDYLSYIDWWSNFRQWYDAADAIGSVATNYGVIEKNIVCQIELILTEKAIWYTLNQQLLVRAL